MIFGNLTVKPCFSCFALMRTGLSAFQFCAEKQRDVGQRKLTTVHCRLSTAPGHPPYRSGFRLCSSRVTRRCSHRLTPSHTVSHRLTPSHTVSHRLTPSHVVSHRLMSRACAVRRDDFGMEPGRSSVPRTIKAFALKKRGTWDKNVWFA